VADHDGMGSPFDNNSLLGTPQQLTIRSPERAADMCTGRATPAEDVFGDGGMVLMACLGVNDTAVVAAALPPGAPAPDPDDLQAIALRLNGRPLDPAAVEFVRLTMRRDPATRPSAQDLLDWLLARMGLAAQASGSGGSGGSNGGSMSGSGGPGCVGWSSGSSSGATGAGDSGGPDTKGGGVPVPRLPRAVGASAAAAPAELAAGAELAQVRHGVELAVEALQLVAAACRAASADPKRDPMSQCAAQGALARVHELCTVFTTAELSTQQSLEEFLVPVAPHMRDVLGMAGRWWR
jgi:hypothetical protein